MNMILIDGTLLAEIRRVATEYAIAAGAHQQLINVRAERDELVLLI
jgi:hypothetical protein